MYVQYMLLLEQGTQFAYHPLRFVSTTASKCTHTHTHRDGELEEGREEGGRKRGTERNKLSKKTFFSIPESTVGRECRCELTSSSVHGPGTPATGDQDHQSRVGYTTLTRRRPGQLPFRDQRQ